MEANKIVYQGNTKSGKPIVVRYPTQQDTQLILDYINTLSLEKTFIRFQGEQLTLDEETKYMNDFLSKMSRRKAVKLLVLHDDKLIGISDVNMEDKISSHVGVFGITIAHGFRKDGIGQLLMKLTIDEAKKHLIGLKIITLGVFSNNPLAQNIYTKMGFREYGRLPEGVKHKEKYVDHIWMYLKV